MQTTYECDSVWLEDEEACYQSQCSQGLYRIPRKEWLQLQTFQLAHKNDLGQMEVVLIGQCVRKDALSFVFNMNMYDLHPQQGWRFLETLTISVHPHVFNLVPDQQTCFLGLFEKQVAPVWYVPSN